MRIFQVLEGNANTVVPQNQTWYRNLYEPLRDLGHDVLLFDAREGRQAMARNDKTLRSSFSQRLLDTFRREHRKAPFDLFFAYLMDGMVDPGVIDEIRRLGVPTCNFSCNNIHQFDLVDELASHFDYNLHSERDARARFEQIGAKSVWWQMASNPKYFKPMNVPRDLQVSFVGANYALRTRYVGYLLEQGIEVHAFGPGWQSGARTPLRSWAKYAKLLLDQCLALTPERQYRAAANLADHALHRYLSARFPQNLHAPISDEALIALYSRSQISLGFLEVYDGHDLRRAMLQHLHLREMVALYR